MDGRSELSSPWQLAVHGAMLRGIPPRDAVALVKANGYAGIYCELPAEVDIHAVPDLTDLTVTCVGFAPDDANPVEPQRAVDIASVLGATSVRVCGASMTGPAALLLADRRILQQAFDDLEGIG